MSHLPRKLLIVIAPLLLVALLAVACSQPAATPTPCPDCPKCDVCASCPESTPCQECPTCPEAVACPEPTTCPEGAIVDVPFLDQWTGSGHADAAAEAFVHWDADDPKEVPTSCAKCHSTPGYLDFLGADGSAAGTVDVAAKTGTTVECVACHNDVTLHKDSVVFPSGIEIMDLGAEARCMECHQGRESVVSVNEAIEKAGVTEDVDKVTDQLGFRNIHYFAAAATQYGTQAKGGYEYEGKSYDVKFFHVEGYNTCAACHSSHTLEVKVDECATCHKDVAGREDLLKIRMAGSEADYDGDGDIAEGIQAEIAGLQGMLVQGMQAYAKEVANSSLVYDANSYPYFLIDKNGNGAADEDEKARDNGYAAWTARLLKAAYNFHTSQKDPGEFAHGGKYIIELLFDSIEDINTEIATPVDLSKAHRTDPGHFAGSEEAFRHWDEEGEVPGSCAKCHSGTGLPQFITQGVNTSAEPTNGFHCSTCHTDLTTFERYAPETVKFPSGAEVSTGNTDSNLCLNCHQGRESTTSMNKMLAGADDDTVSDKLRFLNVHYFAAGATLFGTEAQGAYEYEGKEYAGKNAHVEPYSTCTQCHSTHALEVKAEECATCHKDVKDLRTIRMSSTDFDGDGNAKEGIAEEISTYSDALYAAMQAYATSVSGKGILYSPSAYPYYFVDTNGNGQADDGEMTADNSFKAWTPRLVRAAYNYQYVTKDPGAFAHNSKYIMQVLYDGLSDLGQKVTVDVTGMTRP